MYFFLAFQDLGEVSFSNGLVYDSRCIDDAIFPALSQVASFESSFGLLRMEHEHALT